jgi:hypothetical protein
MQSLPPSRPSLASLHPGRRNERQSLYWRSRRNLPRDFRRGRPAEAQVLSRCSKHRIRRLLPVGRPGLASLQCRPANNRFEGTGIRTTGSPREKDDVFRDHADNLRPFSSPKITGAFARGTGGSNPVCSSGESGANLVPGFGSALARFEGLAVSALHLLAAVTDRLDDLADWGQCRRLSLSPGLRVGPAAARIRGGRSIAARLS